MEGKPVELRYRKLGKGRVRTILMHVERLVCIEKTRLEALDFNLFIRPVA